MSGAPAGTSERGMDDVENSLASSTDAKSFDLNVAFVNCTGLDNLKKWKVESAGKIIHVVGVNATGIQVAPYSLRVLVR